ncbi:lysosome membrane protein 2-like [Oppia nitens]|uniref:lysosome membrane protein 2-like n=1 Tax=Oppia nitens TaxID=1686743 RepID=UPI0023DC8E36|nr:lysosome membrane protein 2-like [Oppia nitens]
MEQFIGKVSKFAKNKSAEFGLFIGLALVAIGALLILVFPVMLGIGLDNNFKLTEGKYIFDKWRELPIPLTTKVYLFDIQNPDQFSKGAVPVVKELGPYVYKSKDNNRVKYYETLKFVFDPELSNGRLTDKVTMVNVPLLLIFSIIDSAVEKFPLTAVVTPIVNNVVNALLATHRERLIETRMVGEVINGRHLAVLDTIDIVAKPLRLMGLPIPEYGISMYKLKNNRYGFLSMRNNTRFGPFEQFTGETQANQFNKFASYKDSSRLGIYRHSTCDAINGSDGSFFGTFLDNTHPLYLFNLHACRSFRIDYVGDSSVDGISTYRYEFPDNIFDGPDYQKDNWCFCPKGTDPYKCHGMYDMSHCLSGIPFAMTFPHFLNAERFLTAVHGLRPDRDKHKGYFNIEPTLGTTLEGSGRFQINLKLKPFTFVPGLSDFKPTLLPYLWIDEGAQLNGWLFTFVKVGSYTINGAHTASIMAIMMGLGMSLMAGFMKYKRKKKINVKPVNDYNNPTINIITTPDKDNKNNTIGNSSDNNNIDNKSLRSFQSMDDFKELNVSELSDQMSQTPVSINTNNTAAHLTIHSPDVEADMQTLAGQLFIDNSVLATYSDGHKERIYPELVQINREVHTLVKTVDIDMDIPINDIPDYIINNTQNKRKISADSQKSNVSHHGEQQQSGHTSRSELTLPPVEDEEIHTTVIMQRKPYGNEVIGR